MPRETGEMSGSPLPATPSHAWMRPLGTRVHVRRAGRGGEATMPCLFALFAAFAPRLALFFLWILTPLVSRGFGSFIVPLLGIIFLPFTTPSRR